MASIDKELILSLCCGLGSLKGPTGYEKDPECIECLKDLQKILREDDPDFREAFFFLSELDVPRQDLVPLIITYSNEPEVVYNALKVLTFLSMPVEHARSDNHFKQRQYIHNVKTAIVRGSALSQLVGFFANHLNDSNMRREDTMRVQLVLVFVRNLLCTVDGNEGQITHEEILNQMIDESVIEVLIAMGQRICQAKFKKDAPVLLQIFCEIFRYVTPEALLNAKRQSVQPPKQQPKMDGQERRRLQIASISRSLRYGGKFVNKYNDFRGTVVVKDLNKNAGMKFNQAATLGSKTKATTANGYQEGLLLKLRTYADKFLKESYNILMGVIAKELEPGLLMSNLDRDDFLRFFRLALFFTRYISIKQERAIPLSQGKKDEPKASETKESSPFDFISTTTSSTVFRILQSIWLSTIGCKVSERDPEMQGACVEFLKELLFALDFAARNGSKHDKRAADKLQRRLLQDANRSTGIFPVLAHMAREFNPNTAPRNHGPHLCEAIHLVLKTYERLISEHGGYAVKRKKRKVSKRKRKSSGLDSPQEPQEEAKQENGEKPASPKLDVAEGTGQEEDTAKPSEANAREKDPMEELLEEMDGSDSDDDPLQFVEVDFDLNDRIRRNLARPEVVHFYIYLLRDYARNGEYINHCIVSFLRRLTHRDHLNMGPLLYQVSFLRVFQKILKDPIVARHKAFDQVRIFCTNTITGLVAKLAPRAQPSNADIENRVESINLMDDPQPTSETRQTDEQKEADRKEEKAESAMHDACGKMLFVEMLFPKQYWTANLIQQQYNWKEISQEQQVNGDNLHEEFRIEISEDDDMGTLEIEQLELSEESRGLVQAAFEENNGKTDCYSAMAGALASEEWTEEKVALACRTIGLRKGNLTEKQAARLRELFSELKEDPEREIKIAGALPGGFDAFGIQRALLQMKLIEPPKRTTRTQKTRRRSALQPTVDKEIRVAVLKHFEENNGKKECYENIATAMGGGWTATRVRRVCKNLGLKKGCLTDAQEIHLKEIHAERKSEPKIADKIAITLSGGFRPAAIRRKLREMGLIPAAKKKGAAKKLETLDGTSEDEAQENTSPKGKDVSESDAMSTDAGSPNDAGPSRRSNANPGIDPFEYRSDSDNGAQEVPRIKKKRRISKLIRGPEEDLDTAVGDGDAAEANSDGLKIVDIEAFDLDEDEEEEVPSRGNGKRCLMISSEDDDEL
ncbi:hypothetical protein BSKO_01807 [Bryopsis sp. KO-2023]|nr:hypothetical protein BSKO_01807 [Bryopsis sp. KO-2023]